MGFVLVKENVRGLLVLSGGFESLSHHSLTEALEVNGVRNDFSQRRLLLTPQRESKGVLAQIINHIL
jgi:hypothetical protein